MCACRGTTVPGIAETGAAPPRARLKMVLSPTMSCHWGVGRGAWVVVGRRHDGWQPQRWHPPSDGAMICRYLMFVLGTVAYNKYLLGWTYRHALRHETRP